MDALNKQCSLESSRTFRRFYGFLIFMMILTGFGQLPIFKRYYLADIPGLYWTGDFFITHALHYIGAAFLFAVFSYKITRFFMTGARWEALSKSGWARIIVLAGVTVTGIFRVLKNQPDIMFSPNFTMAMDFAHLGLSMVFMFMLLGFLIFKAKWLKE